ncbi:hypothetical protein Tco_0506096 [Tanacetum coccineum]
MTTRAHQIVNDYTLVAPKNSREIGKCKMRIDPKMKRPKETTYQLVLDALTVTTCYSAFLITTDVPVIYMNQLWDTVYKHGSSYRFKIDSDVHRIRRTGRAGKSGIATAFFYDKNSSVAISELMKEAKQETSDWLAQYAESYVASADQCHSSSKFGGRDLRSGNNNSNDSSDYYTATNSYGTSDYGAPRSYGNNTSYRNDFRLLEWTI